jgi:hypothetical protein
MPQVINRRMTVLSLLSAITIQPAWSRTCNTRYKGDVISIWLKDGRNMKLVEQFEFTGSDCRRWVVPKGTIVDGASIPSFLWSFVGGPFEDRYRDASVIHDHYCVTRTRKASDVHKVFYDCMIHSGVSRARAGMMYEAVNAFGPKWKDPAIDDPACDVVDKNFNSEKCSLNSQRPERIDKKLNRNEFEQFVRKVEPLASTSDLVELKRILDTL